MKHIWKALNRRREEVENHKFFAWMNSQETPLRSRFIFSPLMIDFIMSFADLNKWFLRYEEPKGPLEEAINEHTAEDATHSRLFIRNWEQLALGDTLDWSASKSLWWMFHSSRGWIVRQFGMKILRWAVRLREPQVRFPMMEAIEICGDVFFGHTAPIAERLAQQPGGMEHVYYGHYHRERETGHLQADEGSFHNVTLSPQQSALATSAVHSVFDEFIRILDALRKFADEATNDYCAVQRAIEHEYCSAMRPPEMGREVAPGAPPAFGIPVDPMARALLALISERQKHLMQHPFLEWLRDGSLSPLRKLRGFTPLWGIDILGYKDFNEVALRYAAPTSEAEHAINAWTERLASHGALFLQDWKALRLDGILGWRMGDAIAYYFLSEQTEVHRHCMAEVKKHVFRHDDPVVRFWILFALESAGAPLFEATRNLAIETESELGITLNYWSGRHGLAEPNQIRLHAHDFFRDGLSQEQARSVTSAIETIFDNLQEQFALSHEVSAAGLFSKPPESLPPPRLSEVVPRTVEEGHSQLLTEERKLG